MTVYPVQMHNTSQMSFNPATGLIYVPIAVENTFSFVAAKGYTPTPEAQNFGLNLGGARGGIPMASPPPHGPERKNPDGSKVTGGILSAWDPATQKERWFSLGGGQTGGGTVSLASNLVIQTMSNGRMKAFTADKGEKLLDIALPLTSGVGPPMTFMLDGKQYIAVMGGCLASAGRNGPASAAIRNHLQIGIDSLHKGRMSAAHHKEIHPTQTSLHQLRCYFRRQQLSFDSGVKFSEENTQPAKSTANRAKIRFQPAPR